MRRIVPSALTLTAILCAFAAIAWAGTHPLWACTAILIASLLDMVDGRVARALNAQTKFGAELDSLADAIAFGVAPALVAYAQLAPTRELVPGIDLALLPCFAFTAAAVSRLARFNTDPDSQSGESFLGAPTPVGGLMVATSIMMPIELSWSWPEHAAFLISILLGAAALMVAPLRFPSFKRFRTRFGKIAYFGAMACGLAMLVVGWPGGTVLFALLGVYIVRGFLTALTP